MAKKVRLRLTFGDTDILSDSQKIAGLDRCWILVSPKHRLVADVAAYIVDSFALHHACPSGVLLYVDDFVLPSFGSTDIFKDEDAISVRKRHHKIQVEENDDTVIFKDEHTGEKQHFHDKKPVSDEHKMRQKGNSQGKKQRRTVHNLSNNLQDIACIYATTAENIEHLDNRCNQVSARLEGCSDAANFIHGIGNNPSGTSGQKKKRRRLKHDASEKIKLPCRDNTDKDLNRIVSCGTMPGGIHVNLESEKRSTNWDELVKEHQAKSPSFDGWVSWTGNRNKGHKATNRWGHWESSSRKTRYRWNSWVTPNEKVNSWLLEQVM